MPDYSAFNLIPKLSPPIFVYFNLVGRYIGVSNDALAAGINAGAGDIFGELVWNFMTNTKTSLMTVIKCGVSYFLGAFLAIRFVLPMTGISPSPIIYAVSAVMGGHAIKWFMTLFLNK